MSTMALWSEQLENNPQFTEQTIVFALFDIGIRRKFKACAIYLSFLPSLGKKLKWITSGYIRSCRKWLTERLVAFRPCSEFTPTHKPHFVSWSTFRHATIAIFHWLMWTHSARLCGTSPRMQLHVGRWKFWVMQLSMRWLMHVWGR